MGNLVPQNRKGDLVGHIKDLGRRGPYERAYATNEDLGFHTDSTDFAGLMCLRPARYVGESFAATVDQPARRGRPLCPEYAIWRSGY